MRIVLLGPDGAGKSSVIQGLMNSTQFIGRKFVVRHLKPRLLISRGGNNITVVVDPHGKTPRSAFTSILKICIWLGEEWYALFFHGEKNTVLICDRYYHDLLVDPLRYRFGGPMWLARLIGNLMPHPRLWVLLDAPADVLQTRKQEVSLQETRRQRDAYLNFVRTQKSHVIVNASQDLASVIADVAQAIRIVLS